MNATHTLMLAAMLSLGGTSMIADEQGAQPSLAGPIGQIVAPAKPGNPRNTEGSILALRTGRLMLAYTRFQGTEDEAPADIVARFSRNLGQTWSDEVVLQPNDAKQNVMSVSLLRLASGELLLGYLRKNSLEDCMVYVRKSSDEGVSWGPETLVTKPTTYYVMNNDRIIQLRSGRLLAPCSDHSAAPQSWAGKGLCFYSDDNGTTWQRGRELGIAGAAGLQEPGLVELKDGRVLMIIRCSLGSVYKSYSANGGISWSEPVTTGLTAPVAPATIKRIPSTGDLLIIWNNDPKRRVPLTSAISRDEGNTWEDIRDIEPTGESFAYTSVCFVEDLAILSYWTLSPGGYSLKVTRIPVRCFYGGP